MSGKDMCVCKHALDKHDEDGVCKHDCDVCEAFGFQLDARVSPELTEADIVGLLGCIDRDFTLGEQRAAEIVIGKAAFQLFGQSLNDLVEQQQANRKAART